LVFCFYLFTSVPSASADYQRFVFVYTYLTIILYQFRHFNYILLTYPIFFNSNSPIEVRSRIAGRSEGTSCTASVLHGSNNSPLSPVLGLAVGVIKLGIFFIFIIYNIYSLIPLSIYIFTHRGRDLCRLIVNFECHVREFVFCYVRCVMSPLLRNVFGQCAVLYPVFVKFVRKSINVLS
jgi:hypothetical protein